MKRKLILPAIMILLALLTLAAYWQVRDCDFVNYDDNLYVTGNQHVQAGISLEGIKWAFTAFDAANWHPLTWISLMADTQSGLVSADRFHLTNLLLHLANVLLLFLLLRRLTKSAWRSALVAALFAVHPLHVESVAWISERKDVLSTLFWLLTTWAYVRYAERPGIGRYAPVVVLLALGLMCKPMMVTLPLTLLLLDYWPLRVLQTKDRRLQKIREKAPLFVLSIASSIVTFYAQRGQAMETIAALPITARLSNAVVAYVQYLWKMVWPTRLAILYPHPGPTLPVWLIAVSAVFLACVTGLVLRHGRKRPYLAVGWLWYLITLIPVIGIVQVGEQAMADRYTYVPLIGIFIAIAWALPQMTKRVIAIPVVTIICLVLVALAGLTRMQIGYWEDSTTLFSHSIEVTERNPTAYYNLGRTVVELGRYPDAIQAYRRALQYNPDYAIAHNNLAVALFLNGDYAEAWKEVHAFENLGGTPHPGLISDLSEAMPDPGQ
jgi:protein O-mannosyl-transferase